MRGMPRDAYVEAKVGLAGPLLGTIGSAIVLGLGEWQNSDLLRAAGHTGFLLNLFNLLPIVPLDGGRAMAAMAPWMWFLGFGVLVALALLFPNPIIWIIVLFAGYELYRRWQSRKSGSVAQAAYYKVAPRHRLIVGAVYIGLILLLVLGMEQSHILSTGGHSFRSVN
jgi:Zn-dependent protease